MSDDRMPIRPRRVRRTGDDRPAASLAGYVWRMSGWWQAGLGLVALAAAGIGVVPIELQRRIVDDAITDGDVDLLFTLCGAYLGVVLVHRLLRAALALAQGWLSESAIRYTRSHLSGLLLRRSHGHAPEAPGEAVSIVGAEVDRLGGFVGTVPSQALADAGTMLGILGYMGVVEPQIAGVGLLLLVPQVLLVPLMQRRLNRLVATHLAQVRRLGDDIAALSERTHVDDRLDALYAVRMRIHLWKALMKGLLSLANNLAPLGILLWGGWMVANGGTTIGVVVAFVSGFERMAAPAGQLIQLYRQTHQAAVQHRMIAEWMLEDAGEPRRPARAAE